MSEKAVEDITTKDLIDIAIKRLELCQSGSYTRCKEFAMAITKLEEATLWLGKKDGV